MGTWSHPGSTKKAQQLAKLMENPILAKDATQSLYELTGDDVLFDQIDASDDDDDIRPLVTCRIETWLTSLASFIQPWEEGAITICQKIVADYAIKP